MADALQMLLEDVLDNVEDAEDFVAQSHGLLLGEDRALVAEHLNAALEKINSILAAIEDAGQPDTDVTLESLEQLAQHCVALANHAHDANLSADSEDVIGDSLKTLQHLITRQQNGFRTLAGLHTNDSPSFG